MQSIVRNQRNRLTPQTIMRQGQRTRNVFPRQKRADPQRHRRIPQQDWAAVVDAGDGRIGRPDQDGAALNELRTVGPPVPKARQGQCLPIGALEVPGLLFAGFECLPLVKARSGNDAAAVNPRIPKRRLLGGGLDPCVESTVVGLGFLGPVRDESPAHCCPLGAIAEVPDHWHGLAGPNIVMRRMVG